MSAALALPPTNVTVRRTLDAAQINGIANHPEVRPHIGYPDLGALDFGQFLDNPLNHALAFEDGAFLFAHHEPGRYEVHTLILPKGRGAGVVPASIAAARFMFTATDATEILTKVAGSNKPADLMCRRVGFAPAFTRKAAWCDGSDLTYFVLTLDAWRARDDLLLEEGWAFHAAIDAAKRACGSTLPTHPDDDAHDRAVGAACLMAKAGNSRKAIHLYNRWARFAGYQPGALINDAPATFDIGDAVIAFNPDLEILKCRQQP
jgi:hypothetical protein